MAQNSQPATLDEATDAYEKYKNLYADQPEVLRAGVGPAATGEGYVINVNLRTNAPITLLNDIDGVPIVVKVGGSIKAL